MATISITIPNAQVPRVVDALCARAGFEGGTSAERQERARLTIIDYVATVVKHYEAEAAAAAARAAAESKATSEVPIT